MLILLIACQIDKEIYTHNESISANLPEEHEEFDLSDIEFFNCIQYEERDWGTDQSCKILVAFNETPSPPPTPPSSEGLAPPPQEGECEFIEENPNTGTPASPSEVSGVDAGEVIYLENNNLSLELLRQDHGEYGIVYGLVDCGEENYPFGEIFDLVVVGSDLPEGIPDFTLEDAIYFDSRPEINLIPDSDGYIEHSILDDFPVDWTIDEGAQSLQVENNVGSHFEMSAGGYPKIDCTPTSTGVTIGSDEIQQLSTHTDVGEVMMHRSYQGPTSLLPWGTEMWTATQYHIRGEVFLKETE